MLNLLLSSSIGTAGFLLGSSIGSWTTGIVPCLIFFIGAWIVLSRRVSKKMEIIMMLAGREFEAGRVDNGKRLIETGRGLGRWQFFLESQIDSQLGSIEYMQRNFKAARPLLEKGFKRTWEPQGMLAAMDLREGKKERAIERILAVKKHGKKDPVMWGLACYACLQANKNDQALQIINEAIGIKQLAESTPLHHLRNAIQNGKAKKFKWAKVFGQPWLQYYPEHASNKMMMAQANSGSRKTFPMPRR
jgi:hypothetical protein